MTAWLLLARRAAADRGLRRVRRRRVRLRHRRPQHRSTRPPPTGDAGAPGRPAGAALALDAALRRPGRHHRHQPGHRLPRRARDRRADRRAAGGGRRARRARSRRSRSRSGWPWAPFLTMIFGELVPKNLAIARPMETARATQRFQRAFTAVNRVPIRLLNGSANAIVRRLGIEPQEELRSARSSTELASLIQRSADQGTLDAETAELMERSVEFGTRTAGEIMTPRVRTRQPRGDRPGQRGHRAGPADRALPVPGARRRRRRGRHRPRQARRGAAGARAGHHPGQAPHGQADRGARLAAPRPAAGAAARRTASRWPSSSTSTAGTPASSPSRT